MWSTAKVDISTAEIFDKDLSDENLVHLKFVDHRSSMKIRHVIKI